MKLLYINNTLVDLYPDTVIAQTLQAFEVGQLGSVRANYTNRIKIPKTGTNRKALEFSDDVKSSSVFPYTSHSARYIENGIEIIRNGVVDLKETADAFELNIYSGPIGFFDFIKTKKLWDLDFSNLNGAWGSPAQDGYRAATTGIIAPVVHDGRLEFNSPNIVRQGGIIKHPFIYYHTVIDKIFSTGGYAKSGAIFDDAFYKSLVMPLSLTYAPGFIQAKAFSAAAVGTQSIVDPVAHVNVQFPNVSFDGDDKFYDGTDEYTVNNPDTTAGYFHCVFKSNLNITVTDGTVDIVLEIAGPAPATDTKVNVGSGNHELQASSPGMRHGDIARVKIIKNTGTPTVTINSGIFFNIPRTGIVGDEFLTSITATYVYFNLLFEDINQIDFLKDFCIRFNVKMTERNGVIECKTMDEIIDNRSGAVDWTTKRSIGEEKLHYAFNSLGRNNYFTYPKDDMGPDLSEDYAKGLFTIANENITENAGVYDSLFNMSQMITTFSVFMVDMNVKPNGPNYGRNPGIKLYLVRTKYSHEPNVIYDALARDDYKVAYFIDPKQEHSMHWQYFIDTYYTKFVAKLQKAKVVTRKYILSEVDIHSFDQLKPVYDSGDYFIVTRISNFIPGQLTEVELFKIS
jgi:hypothetical protein